VRRTFWYAESWMILISSFWSLSRRASSSASICLARSSLSTPLRLKTLALMTVPTTPEGEARQAGEIVRHYKTLLSHPAVEAMTYWDMTDLAWLGAPAGLVRRDFSPKPSYEAMLGLIKGEWWLAPTRMATDSEGRLRFNGFLGDYQAAARDRKAAFALDRSGAAEIRVALAG